MRSAARSLLTVADGEVEIRCSTAAAGDFHLDVPSAVLQHRRQAFLPGRWTQLDEVHGSQVRRVSHPGEYDHATGDGLVSRCPGAVLAVWVGDCAPVVLVGADGTIGAAHAGWRGLLDGVLEATVSALRGLMAAPATTPITAYLGPCIHPCCYEFGPEDLDRVAERLGASVRARTAWGSPALDLPAGVAAALARVGVGLEQMSFLGASGCTGCEGQLWFSHRRRRERERQVMAVCRRATR